MYTFLLYIIKVSLTLAAFYLFYKLLCSRDTLHRFNRGLLLLILALSAVLPLVHLDLDMIIPESGVAFEELTLSLEPMEEPAASALLAEEAAPTPWQRLAMLWSMVPWRAVLVGAYLIGLVVCLVRFASSLLSIVRLIRGSQCQALPDGIILVTHTKDYSPFSWMRYIIVSERGLRDNRDMILAHERAHIRLGHSWDLLFAQFCATMQWFNPAAWLLKRELEAIHEYEADSAMLRQGFDARQYQLRLFEAAAGVKYSSFTNNFTNCSTKKRIIMMMKKQTSPWALLKALYVLPVAFAAVAVISCTSPKEKASYPIRIGKNDVTEYNISDFGPHPAVMITRKQARKAQTVTMQGVDTSHALEAFLNGGDERIEFLAGCNVTEADIDSVRVFFPGETNLCGNIGDNGVLVIYLKRYVEGLQCYGKHEPADYTDLSSIAADIDRILSDIAVGNDGTTPPLLVFVLSDGTEIFTIQNEWDIKFLLTHSTLNQDIDKIKVISPKEAKETYGNHGANGAVKIHVNHKNREDIFDTLRELATDKTPLKVQIKVPSDGKENLDEMIAVGYKSETQGEEQGEVFQVVEEQPIYPGGMDELMKFMQTNIRYPKEAQERGLQGRVIVQFVVNKDGSICDEQVVKSVDPQLDAEAIRIIRSMPNWTPGKQRGEPVRVRFTLPVTFRLQ